MKNKKYNTFFEKHATKGVLLCWVLLLATLFFMTSCAAKKTKITTFESAFKVEKLDSVATTKETKITNTIYKGGNEDFFLPLSAEGKIPNFKKSYTSGQNTIEIEKTDFGLIFKLLQKELKTTDTILTNNREKFSNTATNSTIKSTDNETTTITRWSKFQWFLLLFFIVGAVFIIYRILKIFRP